MKKVSSGGVRDSASNVPHRTPYPSPLGAVGLKKYNSVYKDLEATSLYLSSSSSSSFAEEGSTKICGAGIIKAFKKKTCGAHNNTTKSTTKSGVSPTGYPPTSSSSSSSRSVSSSLSTPVSVDAFIDEDANSVGQQDRNIDSKVSEKKKKKKKDHRSASSFRRRGGSGRPGKILECLLFLDTEQGEIKKDNVQQRKMEEKYRYQQQKAVQKDPAKTTGTTPPSTTSEMARKTTNQSQNLQETSSVKKTSAPSAFPFIVSGLEENEVVKSTTTHETSEEAEEEGTFFTFDDNTTVPACNIVVSKVSSKSFEGEFPTSTPSSSHLATTQKKSPSSMTPKRMGLPPRPPMSPSTNLSHSKQKTKTTPLSPLTQSSPTKTSVLSPVNISSYSNLRSCSSGTAAGDDDDNDGVVQIDPSVIKSRIAEMKKLQQIQQMTSNHTSDKQNNDVNRDENQPIKGHQSLLIDHSTRSDRAVNAAMVKILKAMAVNVGQDDGDFGSITSGDIGGEDFDGRLSTLLDISTRRGDRTCILTQNADFEDIVGDENCPKGILKDHLEDPQSDDNDKSSPEFEKNAVSDRIQNKAIQDKDTSCPRADAVNDKDTIASLKQERESYKSEAMALHEEIEQIKNQLAELRRHLSISTNGQTGSVLRSSALLHVNKKYQQYPDVKNCQTEDSYMGDDSIQNSFLQCQSKSERTERNEVPASTKAIPSSLSPIIGSVSTSSSSSSSLSDEDCSDDSVQSETLHSQYPLPYGIQPRGY